jgi:hypothetical protein
MTTSSTQRNWPPIVAALAGAVLIFLVLPNPLNVPQQNPSSSAEYAPVPGKQQEAATANFAQTNTASSAGIGAGGEGVGALPGVPPPSLPEFKPRQKSCVGNPPRQTEDPLSPPCVPFFEGNNGGATWPGVTKDEIKIVLYNDRCCDGDMTTPYKPSDEEQSNSIYPHEVQNLVRTVKAQLRFFQSRYQTYDRTVRVIAQMSSGNLGASCASRQSDAAAAWREHKPFGVVYMNEGNRVCYMDEMRKHGVANFGTGFALTLSEYEQRAPLVWGFFPGNEVRAAQGASMMCRSLKDQTAKFAGDPAYHDLTRSFGFIRPEGDLRGPELRDSAALLDKELKAQCGWEWGDVKRYDTTTQEGAGSKEAANIMSDFKRKTITTVVCYCISVPTENTIPTMQKTASSFTYFPEWFWPCCLQTAAGNQAFGAAEQVSFGLSSTDWRQPALREQFHFQAYLREEPGTQPNVFWNSTIYYLFLNLFQAIQAAGPELNPDTVQQGMYTFNWLDRSNPFVPTGGYGPYGPKAVANYNFIDTAMAWWWDPAGTPPGGKRNEGCQRVPLQGQRFYAGEWPTNDRYLFREEDPCTEDDSKIADPSAGSGYTP